MDHHDTKNAKLLESLIQQNKLKTGDSENVFVDVGSNAGFYTGFLASKLNGTGKIYSIELHPDTYQHLLSIFGTMSNVELINAAISDVDGEIEYYKGNTHETHNILGYDTSFNKNELLGKIKSITLDSLLKNHKNISLIKIDVEGAELKVLEGMKDVIKRTDMILIENHIDQDWKQTQRILMKDNDFFCYNIEHEYQVEENSSRPYQCLCTKTPLFWNKQHDIYSFKTQELNHGNSRIFS